MKWLPQQERALSKFNNWWKNKQSPLFVLAGYAGTGKSTLAKHLTEGIDGPVYFAATTGKAAYRMQQLGTPNASTICSLIYQPKDKSRKRLRELKKEYNELLRHDPLPEKMIARIKKALSIEEQNLSRPLFQLNSESVLSNAALVVVDEYSMIDEQTGKNLASFGCSILALGDPAQLKPVSGKCFFQGTPDVQLTEVHRQAKDSPIIKLATDVREGRPLVSGRYGESLVIDRKHINDDSLREYVMQSEQLLVGTNKTRTASNARIRQLNGRTSPYPEKGDRLVCLRNNGDEMLLNGQLWQCTEDVKDDSNFLTLNIKNEEGRQIETTCHKEHFHGNKPDHWTIRDANEFDYGNALTVHKAQGSEWNSVILFNEWRGSGRKEWLYTGITRAAEKTTVVTM